MKYLFDTDILSDLLRRSPSPALIRRLALTPVEDQATSSITLGELYYGARRLAAGAETLVERIDSALLPNLTVVPFDLRAARYYGELRANLERIGTPIGDADTRIAAIGNVEPPHGGHRQHKALQQDRRAPGGELARIVRAEAVRSASARCVVRVRGA